jgi:hypothetical protein
VVVEELAAHLGPVGPADAHVFTAEKGGVLRTSNFRIKVWLPAVSAAGLAPLRRCATAWTPCTLKGCRAR